MYSVPVHTGKGQPFVVEHLETVEDVLREITFLNEGWLSLRQATSARCELSWLDFIRVVMRTVHAGEEWGSVMLFKSKNLKPLGYMVLFDDSASRLRRTMFIFAGYSNGKYIGAPTASMEYVQQWVSERGYAALRTQTRRLNGAAMRLFRKKLGFRPLAVIFEKEL